MVLPDWPLETLQNLALARLWALGSVRWPLETLQNLALARLWALGSVRDCGRSCADCGVGALARQILGSAILAVGDARCSEPEFAQEMKENERKVFFSRDSEGAFGIETRQTLQTPQTHQTLQTLQTPQTTQPFKPLEPGQWFCQTGRFKPLELCQWFCRTGRWRRSKTSHLLDCGPLGSVRWPSETLQNLALARLWALGSVRDCGRSCADCGVGARLWAELRRLWGRGSGAPNPWFCHTGRWRRSVFGGRICTRNERK